jgi:hypothetical protein
MLTGRFDSPHFTGSLTLKPVTVDLTVLGFIPAQINLGFSAAGAASGTYAGGTFTLNAPMNFTVSSMTIFGFPFGGGSGCRTESPVQLSISAPNSNVFDPANLAYLQGGFTIASMNNQCGFLGGIVSGQLAGPGNTLGLLLQTV